MRKLALALAVAATLLVILLPAGPASSARQPAASTTYVPGECGLPKKRPLWIDFGDGSVPFWQLFARPGLVSAAANFLYPPRIRALGGHTVYFDLNFHKRLGSPAKPVATADVVDSAEKLFYYASASSGCTHPWIALNELFGAGLPTPWSPTNQLYRANVLTFMKILADRGAHVFLLVNSDPYTADEAGDWWRQAAKYADFVREIYFPAPLIYKQGPVEGSRTLREGFRQGVLELTQIGIPVTKVGIFLGFQTEPGNGGRERLARLPWFRTIKWQVFAAEQVQRELKFPTIWSWGWGEWGGASDDPDKPAAACVYLWARNPRLCNGPAAAGPGFNASRTEGRLILPSGSQCVVAGAPMSQGAISALTRITHDRQAAYSTVFARIVRSRYAKATPAQVRALERTVVSSSFGGSRARYRAALAKLGANVSIAQGVLGDELRQAAIESRIHVAAPSGGEISSYYSEYGQLQARPVAVKPGASWLGRARTGVAISSVAPDAVFHARIGRWTTLETSAGKIRVRPLGPAGPLASFSPAQARSGIRGALLQEARANAFQSWTAAKERALLKLTVCRRDSLPAVGAVDLTSYLPFLAV